MWICCRKRLLQTCPGLLTQDLFWCSVLPDKGLKCPVCLLEFEEQETVREMPCKHLFHAGCILPWLGKVTLRSIVQILFWLPGILLLNLLHVCNRRRTPVRSADLNYRPTIQNMRSLKKTRWDWSSSSNNALCVSSVLHWILCLSVLQERRKQREHRLEDLHGAMYTWPDCTVVQQPQEMQNAAFMPFQTECNLMLVDEKWRPSASRL